MARKSTGEKAVKEHGGWTKAERGKIQTWAKNKVVEGIYLGMKEGTGKYKTPLLRIVNEDGMTETHSCPTVLAQYFEGIRTNIRVKIVCLGKTIATDKGNNAWDFEVYFHDGQ